ncbi:hypothetical protein BDP67DRAFT_276401 [Colletotrichum lupini]|nr:hypothetical protein BDP67DRAFT_276401 [Colletotrichum lupini]
MWSLRCSCLGHPSELAVHSKGRPARSKLSILRYYVWLILNHIRFGLSLRLHGSLCNQGTGSGSIRHCHKLAEEEAPNPEASKELHLRANDGGRRRKSQPNGPNPPLGGCIQAPTYRRQSGNGC